MAIWFVSPNETWVKWYTSLPRGCLRVTVCFTMIFFCQGTVSVPDHGSSIGLRPGVKMIVQIHTLCQPMDSWHEQHVSCFKLLRLWDGDHSRPSPPGLKSPLSPLDQPVSGPLWKYYHQVIISTCWFYPWILFPLCSPLQTPWEKDFCLPSSPLYPHLLGGSPGQVTRQISVD